MRGWVGPRVSGGAGQLAFVHKSSIVSTHCVASLLCLCLLCVSPALLCPQAQKSRLPGLCRPVAWAMERDGELAEGGKGLLPPLPDPLGISETCPESPGLV